jgi:hypothetical protein
MSRWRRRSRRFLVRSGLVLGLMLGGAGCKWLSGSPALNATGVVLADPEEMPQLGGFGVWIKHDGLHFGSDNHRIDAVPMRTPFKIGRGVDRRFLKAGRRAAFKYRELSGRGFPFELIEAHSAP